MKSNRIDYSGDINFISANMVLANLNCLFRVERSILNSLLYPIYNLIVKVQDNAKLGGKYSLAHEEMNELIDHFWSKMELIEVKYQSNIELRILLEKSQSYIWDADFRSYLISLLRIPEFYYLSHEELSSIQKNPMEYLDQIPMLSNSKSIFKQAGKSLALQEIIDLNKPYIESYCGQFLENLGSDFIYYLNHELFHNKEVAYYMKRWKHHINDQLNKVYVKDKIIFCHKISSSFFKNSKSMIEDNFYCYRSSILNPEIEALFHPYDRIPLEGDYDYLRLAFGLGPNFKLRNVVFTNATLQNIGSIVRDAAKMAFLDQEKMYLSPVRTDAQLEKFHQYINRSASNNYKICFDLSKYSDYLLSQMVSELIKYLSEDTRYTDSLINIQNLPINVNGQNLEIMFGTGAGVKSNFDLITALNLLMIDFTAYRSGLEYHDLQVVGDDLFTESRHEDFSRQLIITYTHFNCKVNYTKAKIVKEEGKISFCNRHFWQKGDQFISWNGLPPGLWMKEIYSMNRLHSIARILIETKQTYDLERIESLMRKNTNSINREFKINKIDIKPEEIFTRMSIIPYDINGLNPKTDFDYQEVKEWAKDMYSTLDNYVFMMSNNQKVKELFAVYYDIFPNHPVIETFLFSNGRYLDIISNVTKAYDILTGVQDEESYRTFKRWIKRSISEFGKFDRGTQRISTKDRTTDYFNEDMFWKPRVNRELGSPYRMNDLEIETINEFESSYPVAEMYNILQTRGLIRDSHRWFFYNEGIYLDLDDGRIARFVTKDQKTKNGRYYDANLVSTSVFNKIYPDNNMDSKFKNESVTELMRFMNRLYRKGMSRIEDMMGFFET